MSATIRTLFGMFLFSLLIVAGCLAFLAPLGEAFNANPVFNGMILVVFILGMASNFGQLRTLLVAEHWLERYRHHQELAPPPRLLSSTARMLGSPDHRLSLSTHSLQTLLDGVRLRLDEVRDLSRYLIGLLIFLGLLGTFWGLLGTLRSVGGVIEAINPSAGDLDVVFSQLKTGLQGPLGGMGTAFSSSLFGLASSLILGFLDLQAGGAQNRFINALEEWLSGLTRLGSGRLAETSQDDSQALLEQNARQLEYLGEILSQESQERRIHNRNLQSLAAQLATLTEQLRGERELLLRLLGAGVSEDEPPTQAQGDPALRHLHNIEQLLQRLLRATRHSPDAMALALQRELEPLIHSQGHSRTGDNTVELPVRRRG